MHNDTVVIIDSSYFNFYRYHATLSWFNWNAERKEDAIGVYWLDNLIFMEKFEKMWFETIMKITSKFRIKRSDIIFARDGRDVWRYKLYPEYKGKRKHYSDDDPHSPYPVFKLVDEEYHERVGSAGVLKLSTAEADDIAAITTWYLRSLHPDKKVVIITGDRDFLQLSEGESVKIYELKGWNQITSENPQRSLLVKILQGDPSDNIPHAFKGCGKKTAERLADDPDELLAALEKHGREQYDLNETLIDFTFIPEEIIVEIEKMLANIF